MNTKVKPLKKKEFDPSMVNVFIIGGLLFPYRFIAPGEAESATFAWAFIGILFFPSRIMNCIRNKCYMAIIVYGILTIYCFGYCLTHF